MGDGYLVPGSGFGLEEQHMSALQVGDVVVSASRIVEAGGDVLGDPNAKFPDRAYIHAEPGESGKVEYIDGDGEPTVRFERTGTATVVALHEVDKSPSSSPKQHLVDLDPELQAMLVLKTDATSHQKNLYEFMADEMSKAVLGVKSASEYLRVCDAHEQLLRRLSRLLRRHQRCARARDAHEASHCIMRFRHELSHHPKRVELDVLRRFMSEARSQAGMFRLMVKDERMSMGPEARDDVARWRRSAYVLEQFAASMQSLLVAWAGRRIGES